MINDAMGGYFELELPKGEFNFHPEALRFQSARAAFFTLLQAGKPRRIWMPRYICDSMLEPIKLASIECQFYSINEEFEICEEIELESVDWLLYVNYFGLCGKYQDTILGKYNPQQVVFDHSQAFFEKPKQCLATIYSPRKFFGVSDGGLLITNVGVSTPNEIDDSFGRTDHLLRRLTSSPEAGYLDYTQAEKSLSDFKPRKMSFLTQRILASIDFEYVMRRRNTNFQYLHERLAKINGLKINFSNINAPLCYPLLINVVGIKEKLIDSRIFVPTYWPDVLDRIGVTAFEISLITGCVSLPCDQRYSEKEMELMVEQVFFILNMHDELIKGS